MVEPAQDLNIFCDFDMDALNKAIDSFIAFDMDELNEAIDSFTAEIMARPSILNPSQSAEPEDYRGFDSLVEGNSDLAHMVFQWSTKNQNHISPEQVKAIKFRQSAIEWAAESLGHDMEGKKKLLKVLFEWVECCQIRCYQNQTPNPSHNPYLGTSSQVCLGSNEARKKRKAILHQCRTTSNSVQTSGADCSIGDGDGLQPAMVNRETMESQKVACQLKDCKILVQKVLVQADVTNNLGLSRIMLPKKEAESSLPALETEDGITMVMEEVGTSLVWSMCYRFLLDCINRRKYLLENTGEYVRANGLRKGDSIVLYSDTKRNKYMIRSFKDRQTATKRKTCNASAAAGSSGNASSSHVPASKHH